MSKAVVVEKVGGPEELRLVDTEVPEPGPGELRLRQHAVGLNFIDIYHRTGLYKVGALPFTPGVEGAGVVEAVGAGVTDVRVGDRVAYVGPIGGYAEVRLIGASRVVPVPGTISDQQAAGVLLKGMTAQYLLRQTLPLAAGDPVLVHAAAGGVGLIFCQWARHLGLRVIATAGGRPSRISAACFSCATSP